MVKTKWLPETIRDIILSPLLRIASKTLELFGIISADQKSLIRLIPFIDKLNHLEAKVSLFGVPFYFDALKLGIYNYLSLVETRINQDYFCLKNLTINDPVVLDVGAHIGVFSRFVLGEKDSATVYSFEPDPQSFSFLKKNLSTYENAYCIQKGVLDKKSQTNLYRSNSWQWGTTISHDFVIKKEKVEEFFNTSDQVDTIDLDTFCEENKIPHVDLLVINVPGEIECDILQGAKELIKQFRPQVTVSVYKKNLKSVSLFFNEIGNYHEAGHQTNPNLDKFLIFTPLK
jgi:FkbM family methyltransferase